uniref:Uncharacterized protein n=1 Tax=Craspedostauros australis TaxID=1486917 RepID=A0A7R9WTN6_9STRA
MPLFVMTHSVAKVSAQAEEPSQPNTRTTGSGNASAESSASASPTQGQAQSQATQQHSRPKQQKQQQTRSTPRSLSTLESALEDAIRKFDQFQMPTVEQAIRFLSEYGAGKGPNLSSPKHVSFDERERNQKSIWHDMTRTPLPYAPDMKIYCLYGVGLDTERAYFYKRNEEHDPTAPDNSSEGGAQHQASTIPFVLDTSVDDPDHNIKSGVKYSDGDHSVPLISLGYMCADAWRRKDSGLNPSGIPIVTREYKNVNEFDSSDPMRGGPYSADHVDILGNIDMLTDFIKIVTEHEDVPDKFESNIREISQKINESGGLFKRR